MEKEVLFLQFVGGRQKSNPVNQEVTIRCLTYPGREKIRHFAQDLQLGVRAPGRTCVILSPNDGPTGKFKIEMPVNGNPGKDCRESLKRLSDALREEANITIKTISQSPAANPKIPRNERYRNTHGRF